MRSLIGIRWVGVAVVAWLAQAEAVSAQQVEQHVALRTGLNAVYFEVDPVPDDARSVFGDLPIAAVWTRADEDTSVLAAGDGPGDGEDVGLVPTDTGWRVWFPPDRPEHVVSTFRVLRGGRVYLIEATAEATLTIAGQPHAGDTRWRKGFNLSGFHVNEDPTKAATFSDYLAGSPVHGDQVVFGIEADGTLSPVTTPSDARIEPGVGYWVEADENASYDGPIRIDEGSLRCVELAPGVTEHELEVVNLSGVGGEVSISVVASDVASSLMYDTTDADDGESGTGWQSLSRVTLPLEPVGGAKSNKVLRLALDQSRLSEAATTQDADGYHCGLLKVSTDAGYERYVPVRLRGDQPSGLWVGEVSVDGVESVTAAGDGTGVSAPFTFRVILHRSDLGVYKLMREVVLITDDHGGPSVLVTPQCEELLTGETIAPRISTANFSFASPVTLTGGFESQLAATIFLSPADPGDPYRHTFHPDHANGLAGGLIRSVSFTFDGDGGGDPGWGITRLGGTYEEHIAGLHREVIDVSGTFEIRKISDIGSLCGQ